MADIAMPLEVVAWMRARNWGAHHLEWHVTRQWDKLSAGQRAAAIARGWRRSPVQEGSPGNGREFLVMHRAMIELLLAAFPAHTGLFAGWITPPTNPADVADPVPPAQPQAFDKDKLNGVRLIDGSPTRFTDDDDFGLFVETMARPMPNDPRATSPDRRAGVHNYLHNRFSDDTSTINLGNPLVNIENERFWKLHGWIDARWMEFRAAIGQPEDDATLRGEIEAVKSHMSGAVHVHGLALASAAESTPLSDLPRGLTEPFRPSLAREFEAHMAAALPLTDRAALVRGLRIAARLELTTIPLYLTAYWSLNTDEETAGPPADILYEVALEEMLHMGLVCNMLAGIGETPDFATPDNMPRYPTDLPGIAAVDRFPLEAFSDRQLRRFLQIELPEHGPIPDLPALASAGMTFPTIGEFYSNLAARLTSVNPVFTTTAQLPLSVSGSNWAPFTTAAEAIVAITFIKEQGEGSKDTQGAPAAGNELAHYYQFNQILRRMYYVKQADNTWRLDSTRPLPPPSTGGVRPMAPVPDTGYPEMPEAVAFDVLYSNMVRDLQSAWSGGGRPALNRAISTMYNLQTPAVALMDTPRPVPYPGGNYGPPFRFVPLVPPTAPAGSGQLASGTAKSGVPGFARIRDILDAAVNGNDIGAHGPFWRSVTRDEFIALTIFGRQLLAAKPDGSFDPDESNLVKALEGRPPFGSDMVPRPTGARMKRMPEGFPPVPASQIAEIRTWIAGGCPDVAPEVGWVKPNTGPTVTDMDHNAFWRSFDNRFLFRATPAVREDINVFFAAADAWLNFCGDTAQLPAWTAELAKVDVREAVLRLEDGQRAEVVAAYGRPVPLPTLLDSYAKFGAGELPADSLRPGDPHQMNGEIMWAYWTGFADAALRLAPGAVAVPADFWAAVARGVLLGMMLDGVVRGRFTVTGFANDAPGRAAMRAHVLGLPVSDLSSEMANRVRESGLL